MLNCPFHLWKDSLCNFSSLSVVSVRGVREINKPFSPSNILPHGVGVTVRDIG